MWHNLNPTPACGHPPPIKDVLCVGFWNISCPLPADEIGGPLYVTQLRLTGPGKATQPTPGHICPGPSPALTHYILWGCGCHHTKRFPGFSLNVAPWLLPACLALGSPDPFILRIRPPPHGLLNFLLVANCWRLSVCSCLFPSSPSAPPSLFFQLLLCAGFINL